MTLTEAELTALQETLNEQSDFQMHEEIAALISQAREANRLREQVEALKANKSLLDEQNERFRCELEKQDAEIATLRTALAAQQEVVEAAKRMVSKIDAASGDPLIVGLAVSAFESVLNRLYAPPPSAVD